MKKPTGRQTAGVDTGTSTTTSKPRFQWNPPTTTPTTTTDHEDPPPTSDPTDPIVSSLPNPGPANSVPDDPTDVGGWWVHFWEAYEEVGTLREQQVGDMVGVIEARGGQVLVILGSDPIVYVLGTIGQAENISEDPSVLLVEPDSFLAPHLQSSEPAIRLPQVIDPLLGPKDAQGNPMDGRGVGVAVIDLGVDGTHPDLPYRLLSADPLVVANYKVESFFMIETANTDQSSGHGTHVAGILAGRGALDPLQKGVAPGVKMYSFGIGEASTTLWAVTALDWILQNHDSVSPEIRIVQNSWGTLEPSATIQTLVSRLVAEGVVVVFSAGNDAGDGTSAKTSYQCRIPSEGVICVAAFNDQNLGTRDGTIASYSSRGAVGSPSSWPDLSAPGSSIRSTKPVAGWTTLGGGLLERYAILSGTSMAAPHVSGVAALMLQANPSLSPAEVEAILEATAYKYADGGAYSTSADDRYDGAHYAKGHGLVDALAAVQLAQQS